MSQNENTNNINRLMDVEMDVTVRFGLTEVPLHEVVNFGSGSMIELNRTVDEPVELLVNNFPFAKGEVVVVDGYYSVRITEIDLAMNSNGTLVPNSESDATPSAPASNTPAPKAPPTTAPPQNAKQPEANAPQKAPPQPKPNPQKPTPDPESK